jgi:iron complex transport system substrate-binding protein
VRFLVPVLLALAACDSGGARPEPAPAGVVSLLPSITAWLVELGQADRLVACTEFCEPGREVPRVAWRGPRAAEAILRTGAKLVLKQKPRTKEDELARMLREAGMRVVALPSETIDDAREAILRLGEALGVAERAAAYRRRFDAALAAARAGAAGKPHPKVLLVYSRDPGAVANIAAAGPGSFLDELVRYSGGQNVLADAGQAYAKIRVETVLRRAPDVIVDASQGEAGDWDALKTVPAVRDHRVYLLGDSSLVLVPGPRLPEAVKRMVELIHGAP